MKGQLLALLILVALIPVGSPPFYEPSEGRYAEIGREMLVSGDWLTPTFHGSPHLTKPPFAYWTVAVGTAIFGHNEVGARAMVGLAFLFTCLLVMKLGTLLYGRTTGLGAAIIYGSSALPFVVGHFLSADVFVTLWQLAGVTAAVAAWKAEPDRARRIAWVTWFCFGMAFFTKGPPGLLAAVPLLLVGWQRRRQGAPRVLLTVSGLVIFLAVAFWWYIVMVIRNPDLLRYFLVDEVWNRVFTTVHHRNNSPLIYLAGLIVGTLPWTAAYLPLFRRMRSWSQTRPRTLSWQGLLIAGWILPSLLIFCVARSRMVLYLGPLFIPLSVAFAVVLRERASVPRLMRSVRLLLLWCLFLAAVVHGVRLVHTGMDLRNCAREIRVDAGSQSVLVINGTGRSCGTLPYLLESREPMREIAPRRLMDLRHLAALPGAPRGPGPHMVYLIVKSDHRSRMPVLAEAGAPLYVGDRFTLLRVPGD